MSDVYGSGNFLFRYVDGWGKLPDGWSFLECPDVAVDSQDNVYVLTRGEHPIIVFDRDGNFLRSFGEGFFNNGRPHGIYIADDDSMLVADDGGHTIQKFSPKGEQLMEIGERSHPAPRWSGHPFNRPTAAAIMPSNGDIYISDGYGNCRVHVYSATGEYKFSWGSPGIDPGQFIRPHYVVIDDNEQVYVADREGLRIQIFDAKGNFITMWNNIHKPTSMALWQAHIYIGELKGMVGAETGGVEDCPGMGHRVRIYNMQGEVVGQLGAPQEGEGPGQFIGPHGVAVDSKGDLYVAEVSYVQRGSMMNPPKELRSLSKYHRL